MNRKKLYVLSFVMLCVAALSFAEEPLRVKLVILDNSGTTNDCGVYAPAVVFIDVFQKHGVPISMEEARGPMGMFKKDHIRAILQMEAVSERFRDCKGRDWTEEDVVNMFADFIPMQMDCLKKYSDLIPGTAETARLLREKYGVMIGSTTGFAKEMNEVLLSEAEKQGYFPDVFTSSTDVPRGRPYWYMVEENMRQAGVTDPREVVKVGDTKMDMQEGKAMKAIHQYAPWTVGIATTGNYVGKTWLEICETSGDALLQETARASRILHAGGADYIINTINDLPEIIERINERLAREETPREISLDYLDLEI